MKLRHLAISCLVLFLYMPAALWCQSPGHPRGPGLCFDRERLGLSLEQQQTLADIDRAFQGQLQSLHSQLLSKRLEFQAALGNPQADEQMIRTKAEELRRLCRQCQQTTTDYYLKINSVLTPEQWQKWFNATTPCFPRNFGREP